MVQSIKVRRRHYHQDELGYSIHGREVLQRVSARRRLVRLLPVVGVLLAAAVAALLTAPPALRWPGRQRDEGAQGSRKSTVLKGMAGGVLTISDENGMEYEVRVTPVDGRPGAARAPKRQDDIPPLPSPPATPASSSPSDWRAPPPVPPTTR